MPNNYSATGYQKARALLEQCASENGFLASTTEKDNYRRIWARDGIIIGLAGLLTHEKKYEDTLLATLRTLRTHQGPHGEVPSNVDVDSGHVSLGGTTGRVDANLWYLIGCIAYWKRTQDQSFVDEFLPSIQNVLYLLGCWEFNNRGLLYIPQTGDWTDEYIQQGYVLYDELLYWRALNDVLGLYESMDKDTSNLRNKVDHLHQTIRVNYWFKACEENPPGAYHPVLHKMGCEAASHRNTHWMSFFSPTGYGYRFDALANVLVSLFDIADEEQRRNVDQFIADEVVKDDLKLLPAFYPVIQPEDDAWNDLQVSFSFTFKNKPYEFHNGGLWSFVTGFYVVDLAKRGQTDLAKQYLEGIDTANAMGQEDDEHWGFYEYIHGKEFAPRGTRHQGWSAAGAIMGYHALDGEYIL